MHDLITNYINAKGLKSRKAGELLRGFEECYNDLEGAYCNLLCQSTNLPRFKESNVGANLCTVIFPIQSNPCLPNLSLFVIIVKIKFIRKPCVFDN